MMLRTTLLFLCILYPLLYVWLFSLPLNNISKFTINLCRLTLHNIQMFINELKQKLFAHVHVPPIFQELQARDIEPNSYALVYSLRNWKQADNVTKFAAICDVVRQCLPGPKRTLIVLLMSCSLVLPQMEGTTLPTPHTSNILTACVSTLTSEITYNIHMGASRLNQTRQLNWMEI